MGAKRFHQAGIVGGDNEAAAILHQTHHAGAHLGIELRVTGADPLVQQQNVRLDHGRNRDRKTQPHAAGKGRQRLLDIAGQFGEFEHLGDQRADFLQPQPHLQAAQIDVFKPRRVGVHAERDIEQAFGRAVDGKTAGTGRIDAGKNPEQGRLAGAVRAD